MSKIKLNPIVEELSGQFGNIVFRATSHGTIMARKPRPSNNELSADQADHRERFLEAVAYGKSVMADPDAREFYEQIAKERDIPVFALTVADFFHAPEIKDMDPTWYTGKPGDIIKVKCLDDFGVMSVQVTLVNAQTNEAIENGHAIETAEGWVYTATATVTIGTNVQINVVATDRPGGTAVDSRTKTV